MLTRLLFLAHHVHALGCTDLIPWFVLSLPPIVLKVNVSHLCVEVSSWRYINI